MKTINAKIALLVLTAASVLRLPAAVPADWEVDLAAQSPQVFTLQRPRGETYELKAVLKRHGKPFEPAITNACIYWQTNGMENLYWSAPASISNNVLRATWLPSMDPGATTVRGYIGDPGRIYAAAFQFRFIASPGPLPNELPLPTPVIDFAKVRVLNPPWPGGGGSGVDTNAVIDIANATIATNPVVAAKLDGPTVAPTNTAEAAGKAADAKLTGIALTNRYTRAETDAKLAGKANKNGDSSESFQAAEITANGDITNGGSVYANGDVYAGGATGVSLNGLDAQKADRAETGHDGELATLDANGNPTHSGIAKDDVATVEEVVETSIREANFAIETYDTGTAYPERQRIEQKADAAQSTADEAKAMISATDPTFSNEVAAVARTVTPQPSPKLRVWDRVRQCWWVGEMVNGVIQWEVE